LLWNESERTNALLTLDFDSTVAQQGLGFNGIPGTGSLNPLPRSRTGGFLLLPATTTEREFRFREGDVRQYGASLKIAHDFDWSRLVSLSAYRDTRK
jgi:hypothetical protein